MSFTIRSQESKDLPNHVCIELVQLAVLELRRRHLRQELANVECQFQHLAHEIEMKGIKMPRQRDS